MDYLTRDDMVSTALSYLLAGICCIPAKEKHPLLEFKHWKEQWQWDEFKKALPSIDVFRSIKKANQMAVICGKVSGGLECIDIDNKSNLTTPILEHLMSVACDGGFEEKLLVERTMRGGYHIAYRCDEIDGNQKLAYFDLGFDAELGKNKFECIVETRGEGGLFIAAPSEGYDVLHGDYKRIGAISPLQRMKLLDVARTYNQKPVRKPRAISYSASGDTIFDKFNGLSVSYGLAQQCLERHGWVFWGDKWVSRPDKEERSTSATWGYTKPPFIFYVWSSNALPFDSEKAYSPYQIIRMLDYPNDKRGFIEWAKDVINRNT